MILLSVFPLKYLKENMQIFAHMIVSSSKQALTTIFELASFSGWEERRQEEIGRRGGEKKTDGEKIKKLAAGVALKNENANNLILQPIKNIKFCNKLSILSVFPCNFLPCPYLKPPTHLLWVRSLSQFRLLLQIKSEAFLIIIAPSQNLSQKICS